MNMPRSIWNIPLLNRLDKHMREVVEGTSVALALKVTGAGLGFLFNVMLAHLLGTEGTGIYYLTLTLVGVGVVFGSVGFNNALLRHVASHASSEDWSSVKGVYQKVMSMSLVASICVAVLIFCLAPWLANSVFDKPDVALPLKWMALALIPIVISRLHAEALRGLKRIRDSTLTNGVLIPGLACIGLLIFGNLSHVIGVVWVYTAASAITAMIAFLLWHYATPQLRGLKGVFDTKKLLKSSLPLFWVAAMNMAMNWIAIFVLGIFGTKEELGLLGAATRTAMLISFVLVAVNSIAAPKFASLYASGEIDELDRTAKQSLRLMILMASPILLLFILVPGWVMSLFGAEFSSGGTLLAVIAVGQFINVSTGSVGYLLIMSGHERILRNNTVAIAILCLILNLILVPKLGPLGSAIATSVCVGTLNIVSLYYVRSRLRILFFS